MWRFFIRSVNVAFGSCLLSFAAARFLRHPLEIQSSQHCVRVLPVVLDSRLWLCLWLTLDDQNWNRLLSEDVRLHEQQPEQ